MRWTEPMELAIREAKLAQSVSGDVPVGGVILDESGAVISQGHNEREATGDASAHAEIVAIRKASQAIGNWNLEDLTLVVTLEPCVMCAGAIRAARIGRVVFGAWDEAAGASGSVYDILRDARLGKPAEVISGVMDKECSGLLKEFFKLKRPPK